MSKKKEEAENGKELPRKEESLERQEDVQEILQVDRSELSEEAEQEKEMQQELDQEHSQEEQAQQSDSPEGDAAEVAEASEEQDEAKESEVEEPAVTEPKQEENGDAVNEATDSGELTAQGQDAEQASDTDGKATENGQAIVDEDTEQDIEEAPEEVAEYLRLPPGIKVKLRSKYAHFVGQAEDMAVLSKEFVRFAEMEQGLLAQIDEVQLRITGAVTKRYHERNYVEMPRRAWEIFAEQMEAISEKGRAKTYDFNNSGYLFTMPFSIGFQVLGEEEPEELEHEDTEADSNGTAENAAEGENVAAEETNA